MGSRRRLIDRRIFFPWEGKGGLLRWLRVGRFRPAIMVLAVVGVVGLVGVRERRAAGIRQTRAMVLDARRIVDSYLAEHEGECPPSLAAAVAESDHSEVPRDAWGRPLRLICPGRWEESTYELMSDGPDGEPGGRDRIE